jgi:hypothetical protein
MATNDEFTTRLIGFGLNEKEVQLYLYLLKYGSQNRCTHIVRTCTGPSSPIDKGMIRPPLDAPTVYVGWILIPLSIRQ